MTRLETIRAIGSAVDQAVGESARTIRERIEEILKETCPEAKIICPNKDWPYCAYSGPKVTSFPKVDPKVSEENWVLPLAKIQYPAEVQNG